MNQNAIMPPVVLLCLIMLIRWTNRGGLDRLGERWKSFRKRHRFLGGNRDVEDEDPQVEGGWADDWADDEDSSGSQDAQEELPPRVTTVRPENLRQVPLKPQRVRPPVDPKTSSRLDYETRASWVRRQVLAGLLSPSEIDSIGAQVWGCTDRTIRADRQALAKRLGTAADDSEGVTSPGRRGDRERHEPPSEEP